MTAVEMAVARPVCPAGRAITPTDQTTTTPMEGPVLATRPPYGSGPTDQLETIVSGELMTEVHPDGRRDLRRSAPLVRWHVDAFQDAVWDSQTLSLKAKALAVTYARHARDEAGERTPAADLAWLTYERAMAQTSIGKRAAIVSAAKELVAGGWLVPVRVVARRPTLYRLTVPEAGSSHGETTAKGTTRGAVVPTEEPPGGSGSSLSLAGSSLSEVGSSHVGTSVVPTWERNLSSKSTSQTSSSARAPATAAYIVERTGADDDEAAALIQKIKGLARGGLRTTVRAYVRAMPDEDLVDLLADLRAARPPAGRPPDNRPSSRPVRRPAWRDDLATRSASPAELAERSRRGAALVAAEIVRRSTPRPDPSPCPATAWDQLVALTT